MRIHCKDVNSSGRERGSATWLLHTCDMIHPYVWYDRLMCRIHYVELFDSQIRFFVLIEMFVTSISFRETLKLFWDLTGKSAILVQSALFWISQPDFQKSVYSTYCMQHITICRILHLWNKRLMWRIQYVEFYILYATYVEAAVQGGEDS